MQLHRLCRLERFVTARQTFKQLVVTLHLPGSRVLTSCLVGGSPMTTLRCNLRNECFLAQRVHLSPSSCRPPGGFTDRLHDSRRNRRGLRTWSKWGKHGARRGMLHDPEHTEEFTRESDMGLIDEDYSTPIEKEYEAAKAAAADYLNRRAHSRAELRNKMSDKGFDRRTTDRALDRMAELMHVLSISTFDVRLCSYVEGLQSDAEFADIFARSKWRQSRWAPSRIRMELVARGVGKEHIDAALHHLFGGDAHTPFSTDIVEEAGNDSQGERAELMEQLVEAVERQLHSTRGLPMATRRRRLVGWLNRRGHPWSTISRVLERVELRNL